MAATPRTRTVRANEVRQYLAKADEFLAVAHDCLAAGRYIAATGNAVHAAINAADAVSGARTGRRAAGQDHKQALQLLKSAGPDGAELARCLSRVLPLKVTAEYEPDDVPRGVAARAVESADRAVRVARRVVAG